MTWRSRTPSRLSLSVRLTLNTRTQARPRRARRRWLTVGDASPVQRSARGSPAWTTRPTRRRARRSPRSVRTPLFSNCALRRQPTLEQRAPTRHFSAQSFPTPSPPAPRSCSPTTSRSVSRARAPAPFTRPLAPAQLLTCARLPPPPRSLRVLEKGVTPSIPCASASTVVTLLRSLCSQYTHQLM